jgi:hypothetical protein
VRLIPEAELADLRRQVDAGRVDLVADANGLIDALNRARW